jgi:hypothetical protein
MPLDDSASGQQFATGGTLSPANDALYVHIAGTETVTGTKTFTPSVTFSSGLTSNADLILASGKGLQITGDTTSGGILVNNGTHYATLSGPTLSSVGVITASGAVTFYVAWEGYCSANGNVGSGCCFLKQYVSTPSSFTFTTLSSSNVGARSSFVATVFGVGCFGTSSGAPATVWFYDKVTVS